MPVQSLTEFIIYIAPGFIALQLFRAIYPYKGQTQLSEVGWVVIYGVGLSAIVKWLDGHYLSYSLHTNKTGFPGLRFIVTLVVVGFIAGGIRVFIESMRFTVANKYPRFSKIAPDPQSIWGKINYPTNKDWAVIFLDDGSIYMGYISAYKFDPDTENQDFLLSEAKRIDENLREIYLIDGRGVYLNTKNVKRIEFLKGK